MKYFLIYLAGITIILTSCKSPQPEEQVDHIILVINNLEKGVAQFRELTGVEPVFGGIHPNSFTQNALVALNNQGYIEILAPRTDIDSIPEWILKFESLTPGGWAAATHDAQKTRQKLTSLGFTLTEAQSGSRAKSDGTLLSWTTFGFKTKDTTVYPFFIQWEEVVHPSISSPSGCTLEQLHLITRDDVELQKVNDRLKLNVLIEAGDQNKIRLTIHTPKGIVTFPVNE